MSQSPASSSISKNPAAIAPSSNFNNIFERALDAYKIKTKQDLITHPLADQLQVCDSPAAILTVLQEQVHQFEQSRSGDERLRRWLHPTINVLYAFSEAIGQGIGVFSPAQAIFAGAGVLLLAAKDVEASQDLLIDVFERIEDFFRRLEIYTNVPPTPAMTDMMVKIMVEVLDILATATKEMKQSRFKKILRNLAGITKLDDGLKRLDKMTNEEARMANAEVLRLAHNIDKRMQGVGIQVKDVDEKVQGVNKDVKGVSVQVQRVDENVNVVKEKVQMVIDDGKEAATEAQLVMQQIAYNVDDVNRRQLRGCLRKWQSPSDPSINHNIACNLQYDGTAEWFFDGNIFEEWKETASLLWIHGKPGSGKSILCSAIIQRISALYEAGSASMAYFYFDFRDVDKRSRRNLLPSLLIQLSARSDPFCDVLSRLYKAHDDGARQPSDSALMRCLKDMLTLPDQGPVYLILDALDECPKTSGVPSSREQVLDLVNELVDLRLPSLHICVTSRLEVDINDALDSVASHSVSLHDESGQQKDIAEYVHSVVHSKSIREIRRWRDADKELVIRALSERADGMFRWVFCQLETLRHCLPQNIPRVLRELPTSLDETYERVLKEMVTANQHHAFRLLQCLTVASRPLRVQELAEILALDFDGAKEGIPELKEDWRWKDQQEVVLSTCSSLIAIVEDGHHRVVQFSHFSVKEFLTSNRLATSSADVSHFHIPAEPAHTVIVKACLGILLHSDSGVGDAKAKSRSPLAKYAARHWVDHAQFGKVSRGVEDGMRSLFDLGKPHFAAWVTLYDIDTRWDSFAGYSENIPRGFSLYYASLCGFRDLAAHLIDEHPHHINARVGLKRSPLVAALRNTHFHIADLLHQHGANVGIRGDTNRSIVDDSAINPTLLHAASVDGFVDIGQWLLDHGEDANSREVNGKTPLHLAAMNGRVDFVRILLRHSGIVNAKDKVGHTSLHLASAHGHVEIVRLLLQHGADVDAKDWINRTPLHQASSWEDRYSQEEHSGISKAMVNSIQVLLEYGADLTARDDTLSTPLHLASSNGSFELARLLIEHGADVDSLDGNCKTPLHLSSWDGCFSQEVRSEMFKVKAKTVQVLLEKGADVTARDDTRSIPLHLASSSGSPEIARLLIEHGADVNAVDGNYKTPLHLSSSWEDDLSQEDHSVLSKAKTKIVQVLLTHGADVTARDDTHSTPLHLASSNGSPEITRLLIEHGADVNVLDGNRNTPLHILSFWDDGYYFRENHEEISEVKAKTVQVLLEYGADVTARDGTRSMPLHLASSNGSSEIARLLIEHRADVNAVDRNHKSPLHLSSSWVAEFGGKSDVETTQVLLEHGADVTARDNTHSTPLHMASLSGSPEVARLLIEHGSNVNVLDGNRKTPLHLASFWEDSYSQENHSEISKVKAKTVQILLEYGADVTARDDTLSTPLHLASSRGSPEIARLLIEHGTDVNVLDRNCNTPLHLSSSWDSYSQENHAEKSNTMAKTVQVLLEHGADVIARDGSLNMPLHLTLSRGSPEIAHLLIKHGADVNALDGNHKTPLHLTLPPVARFGKKSDVKAAQILLEHGADVTARDNTHSTPLHLASREPPEFAQMLIEHGADINALDGNHKTPLHLAMPEGYPDTARLLIEHGADVNALDGNGSTPLHLASSFWRLESMQLLIEHGAYINARDESYKTPLHLASYPDERLGARFFPLDKLVEEAEVVQILIRHGADVTARDETHSTPLHLAASLAFTSNVVRLLLSHGANVGAKDDRGRTPYQIASARGLSEIAELLSDV